MPIKAIFFDIDNTLYDSTTLTSMARRNSVLAMIDAGLDIPEEQVLKDLSAVIKRHGANYPRHYDELLRMYDRVNPKIIAAGVVAYEHTKIAYLKPFPGVVPVLMKLEKDFKLGIISNGLTIKQWEKLVGLRLHHFFDVVVTSQECGFEKPAVEIFNVALKAFNVHPTEAIMVGDTYESDIVGARNAGMHTLWIKKGEAKATNEINMFSQILEWMKELE
ncbi:MAG: TIGR02253 family HAD-type hydrolase [Candidatus Hydrothermarchaeales archaeon]